MTTNTDVAAGEDRDWAEYARELGANLHRARIAKGLSQEKVANLADIAGYTYQKYEKGESKPGTPANPTLRNLLALCEVLDLELTSMLPANPPSAASAASEKLSQRRTRPDDEQTTRP